MARELDVINSFSMISRTLTGVVAFPQIRYVQYSFSSGYKRA
jgi:hypothetical protein